MADTVGYRASTAGAVHPCLVLTQVDSNAGAPGHDINTNAYVVEPDVAGGLVQTAGQFAATLLVQSDYAQALRRLEDRPC